MDKYKIKFTQLQLEILRVLSIKSGETINQRALARVLRVSPTAIGKSLPFLEKDEFIKIEKSPTMNLKLIQLNRDNPKAMVHKKIENLSLLYETNVIDYLEEKFPGTTIVLFGSYSRGDDTIRSDIDIAIIGTKEKEIHLEKYEKLLERVINLQFYPSFKEIHKHLRENMYNGMVLVGGVEL